MLTMRDHILLLSKAYAAHRGWELPTLSTRLFGGGKVLERIENGGDVSTASYEECLKWFAVYWPREGLAWPEGVPLPAVLSHVASAPAEAVA